MLPWSGWVECVPNFSEGQRQDVIAVLERVVAATPGALLLDRHTDPDHNRTVLTFAGPPAAVLEASLRACEEAVARIDLRKHAGRHPRVGALDVLPFVPLQDTSMESCVALARKAGETIWRSFRVPVYFYEAAAARPDRRDLSAIRRGGFETLAEIAPRHPARAPDVGGPDLHPTAGATAVGARTFLVAWNVNLDTKDLAAARYIARRIRESSGGLPCVKALGLYLPSRRRAQVSMNLTNFERTGLVEVFRAIEKEARRLRIGVSSSELVGLIPERALRAAEVADLPWENLTPDSVLENRLRSLLSPSS